VWYITIDEGLGGRIFEGDIPGTNLSTAVECAIDKTVTVRNVTDLNNRSFQITATPSHLKNPLARGV
jgi:hypothetical protein